MMLLSCRVVVVVDIMIGADGEVVVAYSDDVTCYANVPLR